MKKVYLLSTLFALTFLAHGVARAGIINEIPLGITAELEMVKPSFGCFSGFTRALHLQKDANNPSDRIRLLLNFERIGGAATNRCKYEATVGQDELIPLTGLNNLSYWDYMYLVNNGWSNPLEITALSIKLDLQGGDYGPNPRPAELEISGLLAPATLGLNDSLALSNWKIRRRTVCDYIDFAGGDCTVASTLNNLYEKRPWILALISDLGKTGTNNIYPDTVNPKFGIDPNSDLNEDFAYLQNLCAEMGSWYYSVYGNRSYDNIFRDMNNTCQFARKFSANNKRLYCYRAGAWQRYRMDLQDDSECSAGLKAGYWENSWTTPQPGDIFFWFMQDMGAPKHQKNSHTATVLKYEGSPYEWEDDTIFFIDGSLGYKDVNNEDEWDSYFCIGKTYDNQ